MRPRQRLATAVSVASLVLAGCTGIPDTSGPQTVEPVRVSGTADVSVGPQRNASARTIVSDFLAANAGDPANQASAVAFLTPSARAQWTDSTVRVLASTPQVANINPRTGKLVVTGQVIGKIAADGTYTSTTAQGPNAGGGPSFTFTLKQVKGQYRIDGLQNGLLITSEQFSDDYQQHVLYYYDLAGKSLVPDLRWSSIPATEPTRLATWLLDQVIGGPRTELQDAVNATDTFPNQADISHVHVRVSGSTTRVEIPGSVQLGSAARNRLATQLSFTLADAVSGGSITITDGGTPVRIPAAGGTSFTEDLFSPALGPAPPNGATPAPDVYYLDQQGRVADQDGTNISGPLGDGSNYLTSIALARRGSGSPSAAATAGPVGRQQLLIGTQADGLRMTSVFGALTRPCWAPGRSEVWIGDGSKLYRVVTGGKSPQVYPVPLPVIAGGGTIRSVRLSPDGSQVALVIAGANHSAQLYVGAVARASGKAQTAVTVAVGITPISPAGIVIADADWTTPLKLIAISSPVDGTGLGGVYETGVDGSFWTSRGVDLLPGPPVHVTASSYGVWTEAGGQIWKLDNSVWRSPSPTGAAYGVDPAYEN